MLRTRGIWAEVKNASGNVGYVLLSDIEYITESATPTPTPASQNRIEVNRTAFISVSSASVYESPSTGSKKLGTLQSSQSVVWVASIGEWAEIRNESGTVTGYVKVNQLSLSSSSVTPPPSGESANGFVTFHRGDKGDNVKSLQARLKELGYHYADVGGNYLDKTIAAVKRFQAQIGLYEDGVATPGLQDLIFCDYAPEYRITSQKQVKYTDMYSGRSDADVQKLQKRLAELGYLSSASGTYDSATVKAVKQVQAKLGLHH